MAACPVDPALLVTVQNAQPGFKATLWRMPGLPGLDDDGAADGGDNTSSTNGLAPQRDLQAVAQFPGAQPAARVRCVTWAPVAGDAAFSRRSAETALQLASLEDSSLRAYTLKGDGSLTASGPAVALPDVTFSGGLAWDPHRPGEVAVAADSSVHVWDVRTPGGDRLRSLVHAVPPGLCVRALSWNPNKPWHLATAGDDFRVKVWDMRRLGGSGTGGSGGGAAAASVPASVTPVKVLDGHTHW
jgi:WD40 repeat protein